MARKRSAVTDTRRNSIEAMRADIDKQQREQLESIKRKLRSQLDARRETCQLWPQEVETLLEALEEQPEKAGRPEQLKGFYEFMAAHFLWRRDNCSNEPIKASYSIVKEKWGVAETTVRKAVKSHVDAAKALLGMGPEMFVEKINSAGVDQSTLGVTARAFLILASPEAFEAAEKARKNISLGLPLKDK